MRENTSCFGDLVPTVYVYSSCLYVSSIICTFRTDCFTNPNPIHLKSYRDIYHIYISGADGVMATSHLKQFLILSGRTSTGEVDHFLPKCALRKSLLPDEQG